jgi:galacturonosyltransferase
MKILLVVNKDITLYLFRKEFVEQLIKNGHQVSILSPYGEKLEYFREIGCNLIDYKINRSGKNPFVELGILNKFCKVIKRIQPDYIFTYTVKPNIYVGIMSRFKEIKFIPTVTGLGRALNNKGIVSGFLKQLYKFSFKKPYTIFFQNTYNQAWFQNNINKKSKTVLVNGSGVNLKMFDYSEAISSTQTTFLFLGRIMKDKGIDELLAASISIKEKFGDSTVIKIAGFYEDNYEQIIKELEAKKIIDYLGFVDNTVSLIKKCSVVVLPSYHEGLSNVLLEAQAIGRPVIASNIPGCNETFIDGISGYSVNVKDAFDLENKMVRFHKLDNDAKNKLGFNGREHVIKNFDRNDIVHEYMNIIM